MYKNLPSAKTLPKITHQKCLQSRAREVLNSFLQGASCSGAPVLKCREQLSWQAGALRWPCPWQTLLPPPSLLQTLPSSRGTAPAVIQDTCKHHTAGTTIQRILPHTFQATLWNCSSLLSVAQTAWVAISS